MTCRSFDPRLPCSLLRFRWMSFRHELFTGRGDSLLRWLGVPARRVPYCELLDRIVPGLGARRFLIDQRRDMPEDTTRYGADARHVLAAAWRVATGTPVDPVLTPEQILDDRDVVAIMRRAVWTLRARERRALWLRFGMLGYGEHTLDALGADMHVSKERARQFLEVALAKLRRKLQPFTASLIGRHPREPRFPAPGPRAWPPYASTRSSPAHEHERCAWDTVEDDAPLRLLFARADHLERRGDQDAKPYFDDLAARLFADRDAEFRERFVQIVLGHHRERVRRRKQHLS